MSANRAALVAFVAEHNKRATFEGLIAPLERICRRDLPPSDTEPAPESSAWYAREIVTTIAAVRQWTAHGRPDVAAREAVVVGLLAGRAGARQWPAVQRWGAHLATLRRGSAAGAQTNHAQAVERATGLRADVDVYRRTHPSGSVPQIARSLLRTHGRHSGNRAKDLDALTKRIIRLSARRK